MLDMTESIAPKSDQLNAEDLLTGPRTVTITDVRLGSSEQPFEFVTAEFGPGRPYKPGKTGRRIMVSGWGKDASAYVGRRMTLYRDPDVKFGGMDVGGIRISHMSHLDKALRLALAVSKGKRGMYVVQPLPDAPRTAPDADGITQDQSKSLVAAMKLVGLSDREAALEFLSEQVGRQVASSKELTKDEAARVIAELEQPTSFEDPPAGWDDAPVRKVQS